MREQQEASNSNLEKLAEYLVKALEQPEPSGANKETAKPNALNGKMISKADDKTDIRTVRSQLMKAAEGGDTLASEIAGQLECANGNIKMLPQDLQQKIPNYIGAN